MLITDIYDSWKIHKGLQQHMVRVGSVAKFITDANPGRFDAKNIISACLLHDLGNLIKSKIDTFPDMYEPEGQDHWRARKQQMIEIYGPNEDRATEQMVREIGVTEEIERIIDVAKLEHCQLLKDAADDSSRLLLYADMRVQPYHIVSVPERFADIRDRYAALGLPEEVSRSYEDAILEIESELYDLIPGSPTEITDESTAAIQTELWNWDIPTAS